MRAVGQANHSAPVYKAPDTQVSTGVRNTAPEKLDTGTPEAREALLQLRDRLLPGPRISRREFLKLPVPQQVQEVPVDFKTMVALHLSAAALDEAGELQSLNHKLSAAEDVYRGRHLVTRYAYRHGPEEQPTELLRHAQEVAFTHMGPCGRHAEHNFARSASRIHELADECPELAGELPTLELAIDETAGARLGGPDDDNHSYLRFVPKGQPGEKKTAVVADSWVLWPEVSLANESPYQADHIDSTYDVTKNKHDVPKGLGSRLDEISYELGDEPPAQRSSDQDFAESDHWRDGKGELLRGWQTVRSTDAPARVYVCGDIVFDPDLASKTSLQTRKLWAQEAAHALQVGGQSPIRGAPSLSPLRRPELSGAEDDSVDGEDQSYVSDGDDSSSRSDSEDSTGDKSEV